MRSPKDAKDGSYYDADYFLSGKETGKSSYTSYQWLPDTSLPQADYAKRHLGIKQGESLLDFGCAVGFFVKAMRMRGVDAKGYDHSEWAIQNCDEAVKGHVSNILNHTPMSVDYVWSKDVFEHLSLSQIQDIFPLLCGAARKSVLIIVPLTSYFGGEYRRPEDEADPSHVIRLTLDDWIKLLAGLAPDFTTYGSYHLKGLKPASSQVPFSCGFIKLCRS
jgi:SAM-dependent methyltransferase